MRPRGYSFLIVLYYSFSKTFFSLKPVYIITLGYVYINSYFPYAFLAVWEFSLIQRVHI